MPYDSYIRINANGDGEGTWSNNPDQEEVMRERIKTGNSAEEFAVWEKRIRSVQAEIVIIDIGGRLQDDKVPLFEAADSFIVLSSDLEAIEPWKSFGEAHGCRCLAVIESYISGGEEVYKYDGVMKARISGLERGCFLEESVVLSTLVDKLIECSGYRHTKIVDFFEVGKAVGCARRWVTPVHHKEVTSIYFSRKYAQNIRNYLLKLKDDNCRYNILNLKVNWVAAIAVYSLCDGNLSRISFFDEWSNCFITPRLLEISPEIDDILEPEIKEMEDSVYLTLRAPLGEINTSRFTEYRLPHINTSKKLYLSGRFPTWFMTSVLCSYDSPEQYVLQPGNHYIRVK